MPLLPHFKASQLFHPQSISLDTGKYASLTRVNCASYLVNSEKIVSIKI